MSKKNRIIQTTFIVTILGLGSKLLGLFREILIASKFGAGMETDAFFVALTATSLITAFITNSLGTTFIPVLTDVESKEGKNGKIDHTNNMLNITLLISVVLVIIGIIGAPIIIKLLAKGFEGEQLKLAIKLTRIGFPVMFFGVAVGVFKGYLHSENRLISTAAIGLPMNLVFIIYLLFFSKKFGIIGLMIASVIAILSQLLIQIPDMFSTGYKYKFKLDFKDKYIHKVLLLSLPVLIAVAINDINAIIDRTLASSLISGSISALNYANNIQSIILGVFVAAIVTVIFPLISKASSVQDMKQVKKILKKGFDMILLITVPATIGLIIFSTPVVEILFQRGEFDSLATRMTSGALMFYSIGLVPMSLRLLLSRVYYAEKDTKTPLINAALSMIINVILSLILIRSMDHLGLALATSIASTIATIMLMWNLRKKIGSLGTKSYIKTFIKTGVAAVIMGGISYLTYNELHIFLGTGKLYNIISFLIAILVAVIIYALLCFVFKVEEFRKMFTTIKNKFKKE